MVLLRNSVCIFLICTMGVCYSIASALEPAVKEFCVAATTTDKPSAAATAPSTSAETDKPDESTGLSPTYTSLPKGAQKFRVRNVYDGDTLTLVDERRVRLLGIDTPEMKPLHPFAAEAKEYTKSRCHRKEIWLLIDGKDHYDRLLGHVFVQERSGAYLCVNEGLVHEGFANAYTPKKNEQTFNWDKLLKLQSEARRSKRGVWNTFQDELVFKTANGSAYHKKSCTHISRSRNLIKLKISEAADQGLHPCRTCMG